MDLTLYPILIPMVAGAIVLLIPDVLRGVKDAIALVASAVTLCFAIVLYRMGWVETKIFGFAVFKLDMLSSFILLWVGIFGFLMMLYSVGFMRGKPDLRTYYAYSLFSLGASIGVVLANDMILLLGMWGFLGMTLYMLVNLGGAEA